MKYIWPLTLHMKIPTDQGKNTSRNRHLRVISINSHAHHSCVEKQEKLSGSRIWANYDFRSIQFSDTLMSDGYFHIFLADESN